MTSSFSYSFRQDNPVSKVLQIVICSLLLLTLANEAAGATKMLMMTPVRAIFSDRQRSMNLSISNPSKHSIRYTISLVTMRKGNDGKFFFVTDETEEEKLVKGMIRYSPRLATIEPGKRQVVKLMLRKPKDLPAGEYQTRIRFTPLRENKKIAQADRELSANSLIDIDMIVSSTFPIIIQHGVDAEISTESVSFKQFPSTPSGIAAAVKFSRNGNCSAFGNVFLKYKPKGKGKDTRNIGQAQGLAIYIPDTEKTMTIPLKNITPQELTSGSIEVLFQPHSGIAPKRKKNEAFRSRTFNLQ